VLLARWRRVGKGKVEERGDYLTGGNGEHGEEGFQEEGFEGCGIRSRAGIAANGRGVRGSRLKAGLRAALGFRDSLTVGCKVSPKVVRKAYTFSG
jgi:hypothetical protein